MFRHMRSTCKRPKHALRGTSGRRAPALLFEATLRYDAERNRGTAAQPPAAPAVGPPLREEELEWKCHSAMRTGKQGV